MRFSFLPATAAFLAAYLLFDWVSYVEPLLGLNITPWNPDTALGLVFWLVYGRRAALPWFLALVAGEVLVRGMPLGWPGTLLTAAWLILGYGLLGEALRHVLGGLSIFSSRESFYRWLAIVAAGTMLNAVGHISLLAGLGMVPWSEWLRAVWRFGFGDLVGVVVSMPLLLKLADPVTREQLREATWKPETLGYLALAIFVLWAVFGYIVTSEFKHFYFLFLPLIWAASRQGVNGAVLVVFVLQMAIVTLVRANHANNITVSELQMLDAVLALVGFFIGIVVDERRQVAEELKQTLRLAAAGEMAAALAHELNQPMTALAVYGKACEHLLARGEAGDLLKNAIGQMINESARAADVVKRLRDFFRTGAMQLENVGAADLLSGIVQQFRPQFAEHGVQLVIAEMPPLLVQVDRLQIELVLRNLLANALDAVRMRPAGERSISVTAENAGGKLRFTVEDSGDGLTQQALGRLFEPFVSTKATGMGLGLVLSRSIVEAHGGSLWAEVAAHGVFRFILPALDSGE
ncbi:GHKL domain-containing protein [Pseudoduganella eburnea]|uniref:histidine kinase n=1 Tax=Massilia eburnea TaxID=1776165 RepID=A0A6L6QEA3_9BURK|nr:ATP-binding protein [Massilia eburnea]MTW10481.1 GHKL domain-containing protein [Massilia eburnea]